MYDNANIFIKKQSGFVAQDNKIITLSDVTGYRYPIALIAAIARNRAIGMNNQLPWRLPEDMAYFKRMTLHKPVIMGRKTFESLGNKPLADRTNIILSRRETFQPDRRIRQSQLSDPDIITSVQNGGFIIVNSVEEALHFAQLDLDLGHSFEDGKADYKPAVSLSSAIGSSSAGAGKSHAPAPLSQEFLKEGAGRKEIMIIGGEQIYRQFFTFASKLYITQVDIMVEGDSFFPLITHENWKLLKEAASYSEKANLEFKFQILDRVVTDSNEQ